MSDCNCKAKPIGSTEPIPENNTNLGQNFLMYFVKSIGFIISLILLPVINIMIIKFLFQTLVLNKKVDLKGLLEYYFKKKESEEQEDDDEEDYLDLEEDEVEMLNVEEIK